MGTNYYFIQRFPKHDFVDMDFYDEPIAFEYHIGKNSGGWKFLFNGLHIKTFLEWKKLIMKNEEFLHNEYGDKVSAKELLGIIEHSQNGISLKEYRGYENTWPDYEFSDSDGYRFCTMEFG